MRVALKNDDYTLHKILPSKVDPLVSLMKVEKVPDSTYDMVGGLDKQIREIKEVRETISMRKLHLFHDFLFEMGFLKIRSSNSPSSIQSYLMLLVWLNQRGYCCMVLLGLGR